jgi:hypothetical protein
MDLKEIGWEDVDWIHDKTGPVVGDSHEHSNECLGPIKGGEFLD